MTAPILRCRVTNLKRVPVPVLNSRGTSAIVSKTFMPPAESELSNSGCLYLVATPIGNLEDISLRALRILKEADLIACEDTRQTLKLLSHFEIRKPLESYHEHNEMTRAPELVLRMESGARVALVSDAGTPVISDPGHRLVSLCLRHNIPIIPIPGPSAIVAALAACGLPCEEFTFAGFLPARSGERRRRLQALASEPRSIVLYEAPHRLRATLRDALEMLGDRHAAIARELTKVHEEFARGRISELTRTFDEREPRGEITLIIGPPEDAAEHGSENRTKLRIDSGEGGQTLAQRVRELEKSQKLDRKAALKQAARELGLSKRDAYKRLLTEETT
jgi:16S rRNA (cytidine1402-2'-O)-methyltransferase